MGVLGACGIVGGLYATYIAGKMERDEEKDLIKPMK